MTGKKIFLVAFLLFEVIMHAILVFVVVKDQNV
jgi:hypothetical protein